MIGSSGFRGRVFHGVLGGAFLAVAVTACGDSGHDGDPTGPSPSSAAESPRSSAILGAQVPDLGSAIAAAEAHTDALMARAGVVGTAVGLDARGRPAVKVFVVGADVEGIPSRLDGVPVAVEVTGLFVARADRTARTRPAPIGFSVGHPDVSAGTLGARVTDGTDVFILSNNHVLANSNAAARGDPTLQPGAYDGGTRPEDIIGYLDDFEPIDFGGGDNLMDAAISIVDPGDVSGSTPADEGYGAPGTAVTVASVGMAVQKYGRTTGHTRGEVAETNVTVTVCYESRGPFMCKTAATFTDQISITPGDFSDGGDSGSLIVTDGGNNDPVGLLFAGSSTRTIANPIGAVLTRFGVSIDPSVPEGGTVDGGASNTAPTASFTFSCTDLSCDFDGSGSSDSDGSIDRHDWDFGDGSTATGVTTTHTYASGGDYAVTLTVTDDDGATDTESRTVSVSSAERSVTVSSIVPDTVTAGNQVDATISGTGFAGGASVAFENGSGPAPEASNIVVVDSTTITVTVSARDGGPPRTRIWDVRVTNSDASSGVLADGFQVKP